MIFLFIFLFFLFFILWTKSFFLLTLLTFCILFYALFLYNTFYDNQIICSWLEKQKITSIEQIPTASSSIFEYQFMAWFNWLSLLISICFWIFFLYSSKDILINQFLNNKLEL